MESRSFVVIVVCCRCFRNYFQCAPVGRRVVLHVSQGTQQCNAVPSLQGVWYKENLYIGWNGRRLLPYPESKQSLSKFIFGQLAFRWVLGWKTGSTQYFWHTKYTTTMQFNIISYCIGMKYLWTLFSVKFLVAAVDLFFFSIYFCLNAKMKWIIT